MSLDFFVLQSSTGAGLALSRFLAAHPQIHLPARDLTDTAFREGTECDLLAASDGRRHGLMLHDRVQLASGIPARVHALLAPGATFVQLLRDPVDVVRASHRRYLLAEITSEVARRLGRPAIPGAIGRLRSPEEVYGWLRDRLFYHREGSRFAATAGHWEVLDAADLWPDRVESTMARLYRRLGVAPDFRRDIFRKDFHGFATKMLHFSQQLLNVAGVELLVRLERTPHVSLVGGDFTIELARVPSVASRVTFPLEDTELSLVTPQREWLALPRTFRAALREALPPFLERTLLPQWLDCAELIHRQMQAQTANGLPKSLVERIWRDLARDLAALGALAPEVVDRWTQRAAVSGG